MSYRVTNDSILSARTDAVCVSVEMALNLSDTPVCRQIAAAGGEALRAALAKRRLFLPVGSACLADPCSLPFSRLIMTASPVWLTGKANELLILHRCYESVFALARQSGCESIAMPFLSAMYYRFPQHEAVKIALREAEASALDVLFVADTPELLTLSEEPYRKPAIVSYVGYYRDHAIFELDNGLFARVDLRQENVDVSIIPYFEACYREGNNPLQPGLPEAEIERLRRIYEENDW